MRRRLAKSVTYGLARICAHRPRLRRRRSIAAAAAAPARGAAPLSKKCENISNE